MIGSPAGDDSGRASALAAAVSWVSSLCVSSARGVARRGDARGGHRHREDGALLGGGKLFDLLQPLHEARRAGPHGLGDRGEAEELVGRDAERGRRVGELGAGGLGVVALLVGDHPIGEPGHYSAGARGEPCEQGHRGQHSRGHQMLHLVVRSVMPAKNLPQYEGKTGLLCFGDGHEVQARIVHVDAQDRNEVIYDVVEAVKSGRSEWASIRLGTTATAPLIEVADFRQGDSPV